MMAVFIAMANTLQGFEAESRAAQRLVMDLDALAVSLSDGAADRSAYDPMPDCPVRDFTGLPALPPRPG